MASSRLNHIDGLRALAAIFVLFNHSWRMAWPRLEGDPIGHYPENPLMLWLTGWARYGHFGVTLFIVISGFCLMLPVAANGGKLKQSVLQFYGRRCRRILPTYYAALVCSLLLIWLFIGEKTGTQWDAQLPVTPAGVLSRVLMLQDFWLPQQINNPFWSIAVEWRIYFVFPLLAWFFHRWGAVRSSVIFLAAAGALMFVPLMRSAHIGYLGMFILGMLAAAVVSMPSVTKRHAHWSAIVCLSATVALVVYCLTHSFADASRHFRQLDFLAGTGAAAALISLTLLPGSFLCRALSWTPLVAIGSISYSVYLMHMPFLQIVWQYGLNPLKLSPDASFIILITFGWSIVLVLSWIFYYFFERPFMTARNSSSH
jgi:peptidoglycan/LPS O-acetylase OafA/YrhL